MTVTLAFNKLDIRDYNRCIEHMINHGSPCDFCEDLEECKGEGKDVTIGCDEWMLRHQTITPVDVNTALTPEDVNKEDGADDGKRISIVGSES